jgi:antitoxin (DNA-binding transcriptional repressor) of toxin-antitoxin stability system
VAIGSRDMKVIEKSKATGTLAAYTDEIRDGVVIVTSDGNPVAALVPIENADLETVALSTNPAFIALVERSRSRVRTEGGISSEDMRKRFE